MMTTRESMLLEAWRSFNKKKFISIEEVERIMYQVEKLLMNYREAIESRDNWKKKYMELKKDAKKH